jgi:two-component system response regulator AtoC
VRRRVLIVDEPSAEGEQIGTLIARHPARPEVHRRRVEQMERLDDLSLFCVAVLTPVVADRDAAPALIGRLRRGGQGPAVLVVSGRDQAAGAVAALRAGATDYVVWPDGECALGRALAQALDGPRGAGSPPVPDDGLIGASRSMERVRVLVRTAARADAHVLIEGETGTGKELVARAVHALGGRAAGPFVPLNCAAVPEALAESEFFGHQRGAFTGAVEARPGALQLADRGTLFLDEIEDLPLALQAKLLRAVQDREVRPLGAATPRRVDARVIAAANRDLWEMVERGTFRRDLYYRLRVLSIQLPPLRQRREDLPLLIEHFIGRFNQRHGTTFAVPAGPSLRPLLEHGWPGNVRELENLLEGLLLLASASGTPLPELIAREASPRAGLWADERSRILRVLDQHRWNRQRAAAALGISRVTLWRRMERHGIRDPLGPVAAETH